jgi:hypothetical protein
VAQPQPPHFSPGIFLTLLAVLGASAATLWVLVRRATSHRRWVALSEWAREYGFRFSRSAEGEPPAPFDTLREPRAVVRLQLARGPTALVQFEHGETAPSPASPAPAPPAVAAVPTIAAPRQVVVWNVLIRRIESDWRPTGLRPSHAASSVLDLLSLSSFPTLGATDRFVAFGTDSAAARAVSKSMLRSLLPADVGLLLHGRHLVLDFSTRPFDPIELSRLTALADQLAAHLPAAP